MKASMKISAFGTGLLVLCAGALRAQEAGTRTQGRDQAQDRNAQGNIARGAEGARAGHESRMLIGHAVSMAIGSTTLKGQAEQAGQAGAQGQAGQAQGGAQGQAGSQAGQGQAGTGFDPAQQLLMQARKGMQESQRLLQGAGRDQAASDQRLFTAANGYINTLFALCGESSTTREAGSARAGEAANDTGRARTGRSSRDEDLGAGQAGRQGRTLSARDKAAVALINHSVCEVIEGSHISHMLHSQAASNSAASETLRRHAREMTTEGRETLQRFLGSARTGGSGAGEADSGNAGRAGARAENDQSRAGGDAANAAGRGDEVSVTTLARRGQELIEAYQAGSQGGSQGGSERSGAPGRVREGNPSGANRSSGADRQANPR